MLDPEFTARITEAQIVPFTLDSMIPGADQYRQLVMEGRKKTSVNITLFYHGGKIRKRKIIGKKSKKAPLEGLYDIFVEPAPDKWPVNQNEVAEAGVVDIGVEKLA